MTVVRVVARGLRGLVVGVALFLFGIVVVLVALASRIVLVLGFVLLALLALVGLAAAVFEINGGRGTVSLSHLATLIQLPELRHTVGEYLHHLGVSGPVASVSVAAGVGAVVVGVLLLAGVFVPRRERLIALGETERGPMLARRRALARVAAALAEQPRGVTQARGRARPRRGGRGGTVRVRATREAARERSQTEGEIQARLASLSGPFELVVRVDARRVTDSRRVQ